MIVTGLEPLPVFRMTTEVIEYYRFGENSWMASYGESLESVYDDEELAELEKAYRTASLLRNPDFYDG